MDFEAIQQGLANAAKTIAGLQCFPTLPDSIDPPTFAPIELEIDYQKTFGASSMTETVVTCGLFVSRGDTDAGRAALATYVSANGPSSIRTALEVDRTLGGTAKALIVERVRGTGRIYAVAGIDHLGAMFEIRIWA
jgi:hypothetical protein